METIPGVSTVVAQPAGQPDDARQRLWLLTAAHGVTHMRGSILPLIYPLLMRSMGFGYAELGLMLSITRLIGGLLQGIWGTVAKYVPGKILIGLENLGVSLGTGLVGVSHTLPELTASVAIGQIAASPQHPIASSMISRWFGKGRRGQALSVHFAGGNFATVLSPLIATFLLVRVGWQSTLYLFMIPGVVVGLLILWRLPRETETVKEKERKAKVRWNSDFLTPLKDRKVRRLILTGTVTAGGKGLGILQTFLPLLLIRGMHLPTAESGVLFSVFTATSVVGPLLAGRWSDRYDRPKFLSLLLTLSFLFTAAIALLYQHAVWLVMVLVVLMGLAVYSYSPVEQAIMGDLTEHALHDQAYSLFYGLTFGASAFWPVFFGLILSHFGFQWLFITIALTYLVGAWIYGTQDWSVDPGTAA